MDSDHQHLDSWVLNVQRKLYQWSRAHPDEPYRDLWNWVTDSRNLWHAWYTIARNKGHRTPGIDGLTVGRIRHEQGALQFLEDLREELRNGRYQPSACRRKWIPKPGQPGKFRPLGIPTVKDRVVQCAIKQLLEPIVEARSRHVSYGFRPGRGCHGALEHIRMTIRPRRKAADGRRYEMPYPWVIEGDIRGCFDQIGHHALMERVRLHCTDRKVNRLLVGFLKSGVLCEEQIYRTEAGTPQGGVISPLLANIALSIIEERYQQWVEQPGVRYRNGRPKDPLKAALDRRKRDRQVGRAVFFPVRYADDFVVLVSGTQAEAQQEKEALGQMLQNQMGLELSDEKTRITPVTEGFQFLGHRVRMRWDARYGWTPRLEIPKHKQAELRYKVKQLTHRSSLPLSLSQTLKRVNPVLRGWANFYRYCTNAKPIFAKLDWYVGDRLWRWMRKKHPKARVAQLQRFRQPTRVPGRRRIVWQQEGHEQYIMSSVAVRRYQRGWMRTPDFAITPGEPSA